MYLKTSLYQFVKMMLENLSREGSYAILCVLPLCHAFIPTFFECDP
jgi:hypothetical protein